MKTQKRKNILLLFLCIMLIMQNVVYAAEAPHINAESAILIEKSTQKILFEKNSDKRMYPASMTKLLTAIIALDNFSPDDVIVVGNEINEVSWDSSKAGHIRGESITVENLVRGLIIPSGNDTAEVISSAVVKKLRDDNTLSPKECDLIFSEIMNKKAEEIGCLDTHFSNPHGYHDNNHYTTAYDMTKIATEAMKYDVLKKICSEKNFSGNSMGDKDTTGLRTNNYNWSSHNLLITNGEYAYPYANGLKTGFTDEAGDCVAASAEKDGIELIAIIFNSEDPSRWTDAADLFNYGFDNYNFFTIAENNSVVSEVPLHNHNKSNGDTINLIIKEDITKFLDRETLGAIEVDVEITNSDYIFENKDSENDLETSVFIKAPIEEGTELGTAYYRHNGEILAQTPVYAERTVEEATFLETVLYTLEDIADDLLTKEGIIKAVIGIVSLIVLIAIIKIISSKKRRKRTVYKFKTNNRKRKF